MKTLFAFLLIVLTHDEDGVFMLEAKCPQRWTNFGNKCFFVSDQKSRFYDSDISCHYMNANASLASIHTNEENNFLRKLAFEEDNTDEKEVWLGGEQISSGIPAYKWLDQTVFSYYNWSVDRPFCRSRFSCCAINLDKSGAWFDISCQHSSRFVCQILLTPDDTLNRPTNFLMRFEQNVMEALDKLRDDLTDIQKRVNRDLEYHEKLVSDGALVSKSNLFLLISFPLIIYCQ